MFVIIQLSCILFLMNSWEGEKFNSVHFLCHIFPQADTLGCWNPLGHQSHNSQLFFLVKYTYIWSADFRRASLTTGGLIYWTNALLQNYRNSRLFFQHNLFYYKFHQGFKNHFSTGGTVFRYSHLSYKKLLWQDTTRSITLGNKTKEYTIY